LRPARFFSGRAHGGLSGAVYAESVGELCRANGDVSRLRGEKLGHPEHDDTHRQMKIMIAGEEERMICEGETLPSCEEARNVLQADRRRLPARVLWHVRRAIPIIAAYPFRRHESRAAVTLADLDDELAAEFNLAAKASGLMELIMRLVASQPGGLEDFREKFEAFGRGTAAAFWPASTYVPLTVRQVKKLAGTPFIKEVASYLEVPQGFASKILGTAIPKIAALLAAQNSCPKEIPRDALVFPTLALTHSLGGAGVRTNASTERIPWLRLHSRYVGQLRFVVPVATLLIAGGALGSAISLRVANSTAGPINGANAAALTCPLAAGVGTRRITGDFAVGAGWAKNLTAEFDSYRSVNPKIAFTGRTTDRTIQVAGYSARKLISPRTARFNERVNRSTNRTVHIN
jgi:uncharacterized protein YidB (DUF937 family)